MTFKKNTPGSSPYYSNNYNTDEYDFDEEEDLLDETDEDTDEASEQEGEEAQTKTDSGQYVEIKEQVYQDQLAQFKKQLQQLRDICHPEYNRRLKKIEINYKDRLRTNALWRDHCIEVVEKEYVGEKRIAVKEFEEKKIELRENLIVDLEEKRKLIEAERHSIELTGDPAESKPIMTRKLRRRPNDPVPAPEKRRKIPPSQLNYALDEKEAENDLKEIARAAVSEVKIEDGKLWYERRWFHRGQSVFVEGKTVGRFAANVSLVSGDAVSVKKTSDGSKFRIFVSQLAKGKFSIKRRAAS
uniref:Sin3 histone deacetylase corepressor complex component SDS3 n=1 Tax=Cacopsylla melanoneura TaxID=428564 RepID=A0A8D8RNZ7_9HEMI